MTRGGPRLVPFLIFFFKSDKTKIKKIKKKLETQNGFHPIIMLLESLILPVVFAACDEYKMGEQIEDNERLL